MAKYIVPFTSELLIEAENMEEACERANRWRTLIVDCLHGRLQELQIQKVSIKPIREVTEVDDAWLANERLRARYRVPWEYESRQVPLYEGAKVCYTVRRAVRAVSEGVTATELPSEASQEAVHDLPKEAEVSRGIANIVI
jgi:hypothetical protein